MSHCETDETITYKLIVYLFDRHLNCRTEATFPLKAEPTLLTRIDTYIASDECHTIVTRFLATKSYTPFCVMCRVVDSEGVITPCHPGTTRSWFN